MHPVWGWKGRRCHSHPPLWRVKPHPGRTGRRPRRRHGDRGVARKMAASMAGLHGDGSKMAALKAGRHGDGAAPARGRPWRSAPLSRRK